MHFRSLPTAFRKEVFYQLVGLQDSGQASVQDSIAQVCDYYQIDEESLNTIVEEGMSRNWPPLSSEVGAEPLAQGVEAGS